MGLEVKYSIMSITDHTSLKHTAFDYNLPHWLDTDHAIAGVSSLKYDDSGCETDRCFTAT